MTEINIYFGRQTKEGQIIEENQFLDFLRLFVNPIFEDYTIFPSIGVWKNSQEPTTVMQILTNNDRREDVVNICHKYCELWLQECVMVTYKEVEMRLYN